MDRKMMLIILIVVLAITAIVLIFSLIKTSKKNKGPKISKSKTKKPPKRKGKRGAKKYEDDLGVGEDPLFEDEDNIFEETTSTQVAAKSNFEDDDVYVEKKSEESSDIRKDIIVDFKDKIETLFEGLANNSTTLILSVASYPVLEHVLNSMYVVRTHGFSRQLSLSKLSDPRVITTEVRNRKQYTTVEFDIEFTDYIQESKRLIGSKEPFEKTGRAILVEELDNFTTPRLIYKINL